MTKDDLRKHYLEKRLALTETEYARLNGLLGDTFFHSVDLSPVRVLHTFLPIRKFKEPDTGLIIDGIRSAFPAIQLSIPKVNEQTGALENYFLEGPDQLIQNKWGLTEPRQGVPTPTDKIDMVLVPLLVVDRHGYRVGYGKGYYDRFLSTCRPDCKTLGISFFPPIESISGIEWFNRKLDMAVTPGQLFLMS
jgi:5-formyltetrahydrofolate cyclo-ligase